MAFRQWFWKWGALWGALLALTCGCNAPPPTDIPALPSSTPVSSPAPTEIPATPVSSAMTLTVWLPDSFDPYAQHPAAGVMLDQLTAFADSRPDTSIRVHLKKTSGAGGLLDLLRTASPVAPAALPDVVVLSLTDMQTAAQLGVLQPLDSWLAAGLAADLFPFAISAGQVEGKWFGLPYAVNLEHLAYDTRVFTTTVSITWTQILSAGVPYAFPLGSSGGALPDSVLVQYMANGGTLTDARGRPTLDEAPLADTLRQFLGLYQAGIIPPDALNFTSADETWMSFADRKVPLANVQASRYLTAETDLAWMGYAALPGRSGVVRPIVHGWALALATRDPARQPRAASLIMWLMSADNDAAWTQASNLLPTRAGAFDRWGRMDGYALFLRQELNRAVSPPSTTVMAAIGPVFRDALTSVLAGKAAPEVAAATAVAQLKGSSP